MYERYKLELTEYISNEKYSLPFKTTTSTGGISTLFAGLGCPTATLDFLLHLNKNADHLSSIFSIITNYIQFKKYIKVAEKSTEMCTKSLLMSFYLDIAAGLYNINQISGVLTPSLILGQLSEKEELSYEYRNIDR